MHRNSGKVKKEKHKKGTTKKKKEKIETGQNRVNF